jgi:serine phosphatase RsbU (regulator of sigma subunit)
MVVEAERLPFESLTRLAERLAAGAPLAEALDRIASAAVEVTAAELAIVRVLDEGDGALVARAVAPADSPRAAELSGSRVWPDRDPGPERVVVPAHVGNRLLGAIELVGELDGTAHVLAELVAAHLAFALGPRAGEAPESLLVSLRRTGEALAAGADPQRAARQALREAAAATGAQQAAIWRWEGEDLEPYAWDGDWERTARGNAQALALEARSSWQPLLVHPDPADFSCTVSIRLGEPASGVMQLRYAEQPAQADLDALAEFAARVAHALRLGARARELELELDRTQALLSVVGEAISHLSLAHTLETAVDRIGELLAIERVGIYLRDERHRLATAAGRKLDDGHESVAVALLGLATGPLRARETILVSTGSSDPALEPGARALADARVSSALAVPLRVHDETIGLLVAYPGARRPSEAERALLAALASQLAVAVQNARLHEEAKQLGEALGSVLETERQQARRLGALYEIASTFTRSLSLERTLQSITETVVKVLDVDAAVIRVPDDRGDALVAGAVHIADGRLTDAVRTILERPQPFAHLTRPLVLDHDAALRAGGSSALLAPFLAKGSTAVIVPIAAQGELLAQLTILSLDPADPITAETVQTAETIATQAALALDNARLYQQQKAFAETIQRALLPGQRPEVPGFDVGAVYDSAARLDVGGDVYDFLELGDGRMAIVLGDVTGHGVDATADMAMAKFVFRSLAREHPEPADFLAHANEVIAGEIASGKFITMAYLAIDPAGRLACACAGHPAPRLVREDGTVEALDSRGLALGIDAGQVYEQVDTELEPGAAVVLYTDGVVEARSGGELYGTARLDASLGERAGLSAQALAAAVLADCRAFAGGELRDDCAIVVARRT